MVFGNCNGVADLFRIIVGMWGKIGVNERNSRLEVIRRWKSPGTGGDYIYLDYGSELGFAELLQEIEQDPCWKEKGFKARCTISGKIYHKLWQI